MGRVAARSPRHRQVDQGAGQVDRACRDVRPLFAPPPRTFQGTVYRPGEICQFDLGEPRDEVPVGHGQTRRGWVVIACLGFSRAGAGVLVFSKQTEELLAGVAGCLRRLGDLPQTLVWDRQARLHGRDGWPTEAYACGQLKVDWLFCEAADPQAKGAVERLQGFAETNFDRLAEELGVMAPLPDRMPDSARRWTMRVPPDPHLPDRVSSRCGQGTRA